MWWFIVCEFTANCCNVQVTSLHYVNIVYSKLLLTSLQQIATDQSVSYYTCIDTKNKYYDYTVNLVIIILNLLNALVKMVNL